MNTCYITLLAGTIYLMNVSLIIEMMSTLKAIKTFERSYDNQNFTLTSNVRFSIYLRINQLHHIYRFISKIMTDPFVVKLTK